MDILGNEADMNDDARINDDRCMALNSGHKGVQEWLQSTHQGSPKHLERKHNSNPLGPQNSQQQRQVLTLKLLSWFPAAYSSMRPVNCSTPVKVGTRLPSTLS
jgi:hypothetical protein